MGLVQEHAYVEDGHAVVPYNSRAFLDEGPKTSGSWGTCRSLWTSPLGCVDT